MDTIFMNSENSKTSDPRRLLLNLSHKMNLKRSDKYFTLPNLSIYYRWKNIKSHTKIMNLKYQLQHGKKSFNYLMDHILYPIFKVFLDRTKLKTVRIKITTFFKRCVSIML